MDAWSPGREKLAYQGVPMLILPQALTKPVVKQKYGLDADP